LSKLDEKIVMTDSQNEARVVIKPYLRTKSGAPNLPQHIRAAIRNLVQIPT